MAKQPLHTFLFADLVGFSALTKRNGDEAAAELAVAFWSTVAKLARDHDAEAVKSLGDAVMVRGRSADRTIELGLRLNEELDEASGFPPVHTGINTGPAVERGGDWFGAAVNLTARVCAAARPCELLVTDATLAACRALDGVVLYHIGKRLFKNMLAPTVVYAASREGSLGAVRPLERSHLRVAPKPALAPALAAAYSAER